MKDSDDLKRVIELYSNIMRRVCFLYMKQDSDVDDIFQNVFLKYTKTKKSFLVLCQDLVQVKMRFSSS